MVILAGGLFFNYNFKLISYLPNSHCDSESITGKPFVIVMFNAAPTPLFNCWQRSSYFYYNQYNCTLPCSTGAIHMQC